MEFGPENKGVGVGFETLPESIKLINKHIYLLISDFLLESQSQQKLPTNITILQ